ncbi:NAD(P)-binding protein [Coprinopsis marcescibilis]|uniref:NAD(P)-binding protein n=1 Tax=Coprinopsis marcescibilis TaxID=230819 RepID=A0A5C3KUR1_COPMA|nr:NAD(P)-binding protein [Coprinopsis marcescibilis]
MFRVAHAFVTEGFPPKSQFGVDDIQDLTGKVAIVTGSNTGVGKETVKALLNHNAKVYLAARNPEKAEQAIKDLKEETGKEAVFLKLDLSDLKSVKSSAEEFISKEKELHILFNNAGVMHCPVSEVTAQGYDLQFGTNVLGHFYFTKLLLPVLISTAKLTPEGKTRIINTSSIMSRVGSLNFNTLKDGPTRKKQFSGTLYCQSKLGNAMISNEFAKRYGDQGIISVACNPGNLDTDLLRHLPSLMQRLMRLIIHPSSQGALTQLWAGTTEEGLTMNGKYLVPWARLGEPNPLALDESLRDELWKWLEEQVESV